MFNRNYERHEIQMSLFGEPVKQEIDEADYREKAAKISPFDFLNSINETKEDLMVDDKAESQYSPYIVNRGLSFSKDTVMLANAMNQMHHLDKKIQYDFLRTAVRKARRRHKWMKSEVENIDTVKKYYGYSTEKAKNALKVLRPEDLASMQTWLDRSKGGSL